MSGSERREGVEGEWAAWREEVFSGMADWRAPHPHATRSAIEAERDQHLARMRARMAQPSATPTWRAQSSERATDPAEEAPCCPSCGVRLEPRGRHRRRLRPSGGHAVVLDRE